jgi:teichuronic acid biosynthesis glycosyltransferase TuaG
MPSYNAAKFIAASIQSVIGQTYRNWELLITDDCSKDDTVKIVEQFLEKDNRIKLFSTGKNSGPACARNKSLENATGKYIAFLDSDDIWVSNKLETQIKFMIEKNIAFSFSSYSVMKEDGTPTGNTINVPKIIGYHGYLRNTIIGCLTVIIDREKTGNFIMPNIKTSEDMALWLNIMKRGFKAWVGEKL